jgi:hypothetical protein
MLACVAPACATSHPFPLRDPFLVDTDLRPVSVTCRPDPTAKDPDRKTCAPEEYVSPFLWDQADNLLFARISRGLAFETSGESIDVNSLDEVPDSSWYTNRERAPIDENDDAPGACNRGEILPSEDQVADGEWVIDHGKDNGSTPGFRIDVPGKGKYLLKADEKEGQARAGERRERDRRGDLRRARVQHDVRAGRRVPQVPARAPARPQDDR